MGHLNDKLSVFQLALKNLEEALAEPIRTNRDRAGVIQTFEFTYETSWKLLREILVFLGKEAPSSPRSVFKEAYSSQLIENDQNWLSMISKRNLTTHTYNQSTADEVISSITSIYIKEFQALSELSKKYSE